MSDQASDSQADSTQYVRRRRLFRRFRRRGSAADGSSVPSPDDYVPFYSHDKNSQSPGYLPDLKHTESEHVFGETQAPGQNAPHGRKGAQKSGQQVLFDFVSRINPSSNSLAKMLSNRNPISDNSSGYRYVVNQSTEQSDLAIILRDLTDGRLYRSGVRLVAAPWANLLFGDSFAPNTSKRQLHELVYRRSSCTCIVCLIRQQRAQEQMEKQSNGSSTSSTATLTRTSPESAMANFTQPYTLPSKKDLVSIGGEASPRELEIGTLVRLQSRNTAKLEFTEDVRLLFGNMAYTGPLSHEKLYRDTTTIGVNYYMYNKGKKSRKVYLQGDLIRLPLEVGVVKNGAQAMYLKEVGSTYVLYKPQVMSIYIGTIVLEGNSIGSFISTDIKFYIGFGQEDGACAIYPDNRPCSPPRRLGINELLLHHHQVGDLEVSVR